MTITPYRAKMLSHAEIRANVVEFASEWALETRERAEAQSFWTDLLACYGVHRRRAGAVFERPARRSDTGRGGFIDVFWPRVVLAEHKSAGRIMPPAPGERSEAEKQAFAYIDGGDIHDAELPRYVMTSDFRSIQVTDLEAAPGSPDRTLTFLTIDLPDHFEKLLFLAEGHQTERLGAKKDEEEASIEAVNLMGALYEAILADNEVDIPLDTESVEEEDDASWRASVLLNRLLFLMAGDDNGLWKHDLFATFVRTRTAEDGSDLGAQLHALFEVLNTPERRRSRRLDPALAEFPYVNGGIFGTSMPVDHFNRAIRDALLRCCDFRWTRISPAIFGALFQAIKSRQARHSDGEHYTSETNILRTLEPLFLDELRTRLDRINTVRGLRELWTELGTYRYMDPACGCGNFLVIAYREMRELELELLIKLRDLQGTSDILSLDATADLKVRLDQFYGIELNWWPAKIAETAMFLVDHQANRRMETELGMSPQRLPIDIAATIHHGNALVTTDAHGNMRSTDWDAVCPAPASGKVYVFGNPPFINHEDRTKQQLAEMQATWRRKDVSRLDFVTSWHAKALDYYRDGRDGEWAFVTTNSITQGDQPRLLFRPIFDAGWTIKFGHRTFSWSNEARSKDTAVVHVVIIGFTRTPTKGRLFTYPHIKGAPVETPVSQGVNAYLVDGPNILVEKMNSPLNPQIPPASFGWMPRDDGQLIVKPGDTAALEDPVIQKYLRRYVGSRELLHDAERWCLWMVDLDPDDLQRSHELKRRIEAVKAYRETSPAESTRTFPHHHLFVQRGATHTGPYLCIPSVVSENRRYFTAARFEPDVIASNAVFTADDPDGFAFSIISSSMFITWQKTIGGRLKSDPRFANTLTWNTLPLPHVTDGLRAQIITAGQEILAARARHPERSLAQHYNPLAMDPALINAHDRLDGAVDRAFGASRRCTSLVERQRILFDRYAELTGGLIPEPGRKGKTRSRRGADR